MTSTEPSRAALLVLTPTLGDSPWLGEMVESVRRHAPGAAHLLIVPAGRGAEVQARYADRLVCEEPAAAGLYAALNHGLEVAAGWDWQWMTFLGDDDLFLDGFGPLMEEANASTPAGAAQVWRGEVVMIDGAGRRLCKIPAARAAGDIAALVLAGYSPFNQQGMLFSREAARRAGPFRTDFRICADAAHWLRALEQGAIFHQRPDVAAAFRVRAGQVSADTRRHREEFRRLRTMAERVHGAGPVWPSVMRFRLGNADRYLERVRRVGFRRGHQLLHHA